MQKYRMKLMLLCPMVIRFFNKTRRRYHGNTSICLKRCTFLVCITLLILAIIQLSKKTSDSPIVGPNYDNYDNYDSLINPKIINPLLHPVTVIENTTKTSNQESLQFSIEVKSSPFHIYVIVNGLKVYEEQSKLPKGRGIHLVVINPNNGVVMDTKIFDTFAGNNEVHMAEYLQNVRPSLIAVFLIKDEASTSLRELGRQVIRSFGSTFISELSFRAMWAFISYGRENIAEQIQKPQNINIYPPDIVLTSTYKGLTKGKDPKVNISSFEEKRAQFCHKYVGYGSLCDPIKPSPIDLTGPLLLGSRLTNVPIAVIASNRPQYLHRMLSKLLTTRGVTRDLVTCYIDGYHDEPVALVDLLNVKYVEHEPVCDGVCRLNQHYKFALHHTFESNPNADYIIILEEDLEVAVDIMDYFSQLLPVLETDESVYCISAWNDNSHNHSANDASLLYRMEGMPGLGWVLKRDIFKELEPKWPGLNNYGDWDMHLRMPSYRKGRECIYPDISRTYHFGKVGIHMNQYESTFYSGEFETLLNKKTGIKFDGSKMSKAGYEIEMNKLIKKATLLDHNKNPCVDKDFIPDTHGHVYVLYIKWAFKGDVETWMNVAECFHIWHLDIRGYHKLSWRFWLKRNQIIVIGSTSPYAKKYKPDELVPLVVHDKPNKPKYEMGKVQAYLI